MGKTNQLLADAGYADGFIITLTYDIDFLSRRRVSEHIRDSLDDVGITVSIKGFDWDSAVDETVVMIQHTLSREAKLAKFRDNQKRVV